MSRIIDGSSSRTSIPHGLLLVALLGVLTIGPGVALGDEPGAKEKEKEKEETSTQMQASEGIVGAGFLFDGDFEIGYRAVDNDGSLTKFREDIDLEDGFRLLNGKLTFVPGGEDPATWFDQIEFRGNGLFGDPYESWQVEARKAGTYRFRVRSREADFFNAITGEAHSWDLTRSHADAELMVKPFENFQFTADFKRFRQTGSRVTSRDISRDEFFFDEPLDQEGTTWGFGARWRTGQTVVWLDQRFHQFNDNGGFGTRTFTDGLTPGEANLTFFEQKEVRAVDSPITRGGLTTEIGERVQIRGDFLYSNQELGFAFSRFWDGETFQERPVSVSQDALGSARREVRHFSGEVLWRASERVNLIASWRRRGWDQTGDNLGRTIESFEDGAQSVGTTEFLTAYEVTLDQYTLGAELAASNVISFFGEFGLTDRDQEFDIAHDEDETTTETTAFKIGTRVRPSRTFDVTASYERGDIDDPFTRISPTESNSLKVRARVRPADGWQLSGNVTYRDLTNEVTPVEIETLNFGTNLSYRAGPERWLMVGYARLDYDSTVPIVYRPFFAGRAEAIADNMITDDVVTAALEYRLGEGGPLILHGRVSYVDSRSEMPDNALGDRLRPTNIHEVGFSDWTAGIRYLFTEEFYGHVSARFIDYDEDTGLASDVDDYDASIVTFGFGIRF